MRRDLLIAVTAGLAGSAAAAVTDRLLEPLVEPSQRLWESAVRGGSPHAKAGPSAARSLLGHRLSSAETRAARAIFGASYGIGWGVGYALLRRALPVASRAGGLPFALPFFAVCDGLIAPLLGLGPPITRIPWRRNAKELANHVAWTAAAELVHRAADGSPV